MPWVDLSREEYEFFIPNRGSLIISRAGRRKGVSSSLALFAPAGLPPPPAARPG